MIPVQLHRCGGAANMARCYAVGVAPTLFGAWAVVREWGRIGVPGRVREDWFASHSHGAAITSAEAPIRRKRRRGYARAP